MLGRIKKMKIESWFIRSMDSFKRGMLMCAVDNWNDGTDEELDLIVEAETEKAICVTTALRFDKRLKIWIPKCAIEYEVVEQ